MTEDDHRSKARQSKPEHAEYTSKERIDTQGIKSKSFVKGKKDIKTSLRKGAKISEIGGKKTPKNQSEDTLKSVSCTGFQAG